MIMPYASKRPCCICHRWFRPNNRVGSRQRACSRPACQRLRHQRNQAAWVARHPDYFAGRRIQDRIKLDPPQKCAAIAFPLNQLPWDIAQDQFGAQGADFIGVMGALLVRLAQDQFARTLSGSSSTRPMWRDTLPAHSRSVVEGRITNTSST